MFWVLKNLKSEWRVQVAKILELEQNFPFSDVVSFDDLKIRSVTPSVLTRLKLTELALNETVPYFSQGWKVSKFHFVNLLEHVKNESSRRIRDLRCSIFAPVETEPLEIGIVNEQVVFKFFEDKASMLCVIPNDGIRPSSLFI